jgi:hypothetical protein
VHFTRERGTVSESWEELSHRSTLPPKGANIRVEIDLATISGAMAEIFVDEEGEGGLIVTVGAEGRGGKRQRQREAAKGESEVR